MQEPHRVYMILVQRIRWESVDIFCTQRSVDWEALSYANASSVTNPQTKLCLAIDARGYHRVFCLSLAAVLRLLILSCLRYVSCAAQRCYIRLRPSQYRIYNSRSHTLAIDAIKGVCEGALVSQNGRTLLEAPRRVYLTQESNLAPFAVVVSRFLPRPNDMTAYVSTNECC